MSTSESLSSTMVFSLLASSASELVIAPGGVGGAFIRQGAFVREGHLIQTCQLRGGVIG